ncbi:MAG: CYTH domain-containing protein [Novosphingobium sp.]|nr:CYTH domain-containing protein [Novosphingobium sp.]
MGHEIERKFLVRDDSWKSSADKGTQILQGYLALDDRREVRVRIMDRSTAKLTIKAGGAKLSRAEFEYAIPVEDAERLIRLCIGSPLEKTRYRVPAGHGMVWEVDRFAGHHAGLVLAEIELDDEASVFEKPEWLGQEVTGDPAYYNASLAVGHRMA